MAGLRSVMYYANWDIYARNHTPQALAPIADHLTHILYSFANVHPETGEVYLSDPNADTDKHFEGDSWSEAGTNLYGCTKQLFLLKKQHRKLKVLLSIGGFTWSTNFAPVAATHTGRQKFAASAVRIVEDLGFDGIDIDWEHPQDATQADHYVALLAACRSALDAAAAKRTPKARFYLTVAVSMGGEHYNKLKIAEMDKSLDFWNLMAYDYAGSWDQVAGQQANLTARNGGKDTPFNSNVAVEHYISSGAASHKLVLGMPLYGRSFADTDGPGKAYKGIGKGSWEDGIWDFKVLPKAGATVTYDASIGASWSYDPKTREFISFDDERTSKQKAEYVKSHGLGGGMWWESAGDRAKGQGSLVEVFIGAVGGVALLEQSQNCLSYPDSKYDNVKKGMA